LALTAVEETQVILELLDSEGSASQRLVRTVQAEDAWIHALGDLFPGNAWQSKRCGCKAKVLPAT